MNNYLWKVGFRNAAQHMINGNASNHLPSDLYRHVFGCLFISLSLSLALHRSVFIELSLPTYFTWFFLFFCLRSHITQYILVRLTLLFAPKKNPTQNTYIILSSLPNSMKFCRLSYKVRLIFCWFLLVLFFFFFVGLQIEIHNCIDCRSLAENFNLHNFPIWSNLYFSLRMHIHFPNRSIYFIVHAIVWIHFQFENVNHKKWIRSFRFQPNENGKRDWWIVCFSRSLVFSS